MQLIISGTWALEQHEKQITSFGYLKLKQQYEYH